MRKQKKYHYIYKTTNIINGRYYIGMHSTNDLEDGYLGSGTYLRRALNKYGKENFTREILEFCKTRKELKSREKEIVNLQEIAKKDCMNMVVGGEGGNFISDRQRKINGTKGGRVLAKRLKEDVILFKKYQRLGSIQFRIYNSSGGHNYNTFQGKTHTEETKRKMRKSKNVGTNNSQYGTCWITNEIINKKIKKGEKLPTGFRLGRFQMKFV